MSAGVAAHSLGEVFHFSDDLFALGFAVFAAPGVSQGDDELIKIVEEFVGAVFGHAVFDAVFADAADGFEKAAAAVAELNPIDRKMDVRAVAGGIIPDAEKIDGHFKAEEVERSFKYGIVLIWGGSGFLKKHREGLIDGLGTEGFFGPIHGAFTGCLDLIEVFEEAEPLLQRTISEGDFQSTG